MPSSYEIDKQNNILILKYFGNFNVNDLVGLRARVLQDPDFHPDLLCIDDISGIKSADITSGEIEKLSEQSVMQPHIKRALVASENFQRGIARMYITHAEYSGQEFMLFSNINEAKRWLLS